MYVREREHTEIRSLMKNNGGTGRNSGELGREMLFSPMSRKQELRLLSEQNWNLRRYRNCTRITEEWGVMTYSALLNARAMPPEYLILETSFLLWLINRQLNAGIKGCLTVSRFVVASPSDEDFCARIKNHQFFGQVDVQHCAFAGRHGKFIDENLLQLNVITLSKAIYRPAFSMMADELNRDRAGCHHNVVPYVCPHSGGCGA
ncbi:hypothetical protein X801_04581, partial [Opisthorchis viverrini]